MSGLRVFPLFLLLLFYGCGKGDKKVLDASYERLGAIPQKSWDALGQSKIFFGHKSVGYNIIAGIEDVLGRYPAIRMNIQETADPQAFLRPVFAHYSLGQNKRPDTKVNGFRDIMESGVGQSVDIALFKFCFVDIDHTTDLQAVFDRYVETVEQLKRQFPHTKIITLTVPLVSRPVGWLTRIKMLSGRLPWYEVNHTQRHRFNEKLRARYKDTLFDLAAIESWISPTQRATLTKNGERYDILRRDFTDDGGHLNPLGRQVVAIELLCYLASLGDR